MGGKEPLLNPDPIAVGIPTDGDPILVDISTSTTSVGQTLKAKKAGKRMPGKWLMTADGKATDDPEDYFADPPGTILPLGGMDAGYKGYALMLHGGGHDQRHVRLGPQGRARALGL